MAIAVTLGTIIFKHGLTFRDMIARDISSVSDGRLYSFVMGYFTGRRHCNTCTYCDLYGNGLLAMGTVYEWQID